MKRFAYLIIISAMINLSAYAQVDTIRLKDKRLNTTALRPGLNQYLVYSQKKKGKHITFSLWLRNIALENRNGEKVFAITQHWYMGDTSTYKAIAIYSLNNATDFSPMYHSETVNGDSEGYNWYNDKIRGADSLAGNKQKSFSLDFKLPNFNWNLDIETFEMLPLAEGKTFAINFYDAGLDPPQYVNYKVTGSEVITTLDNAKADCWKLVTEGDHKNGHYSETYWISKKNHEFLKEEDETPTGYRYKIKMPDSAPDVLSRFAR
jgi:hypothetical protein